MILNIVITIALFSICNHEKVDAACSPACQNGGSCNVSTCSCPTNTRGSYCQFLETAIRTMYANANVSLMALWPLTSTFGLEEASNFSSTALDGVMNSGLPAYTAGPYGVAVTAFELISTTKFFYVNHTSLHFGSFSPKKDFTWCMWVKSSNATIKRFFLSYIHNGGSNYQLKQLQGQPSSIAFDMASGQAGPTVAANQSTKWVWITFSYSFATKNLTVVVDGNPSSHTTTVAAVTGSRVHFLASSSDGPIPAIISCASVHDSVLNLAQREAVKELCKVFLVTCSPVCSSPFICIDNNTCACPSGTTGALCDTGICSPPCQNGGTCTLSNACNCPAGYTGSSCQTATCSPMCANGGTCFAPNNCSCTSLWTDSDCTMPICSNGCDNGGSCISPDACSCTPSWTGSTCQTPVCLPSCLNGNCSSPDNCTCEPGWIGAYCHKAVCGTIGCANGGNCTAPDNCVCINDYTGFECELFTCIQPCLNDGSCTSPDICTCDNGWTGLQCETPICSSPCLYGGSCVGPDNCSCTFYYSGPTCDEPICDPPCDHGNCSLPDVCTCSSGWNGTLCDVAICSQSCLNGGSCDIPDHCSCAIGWTGFSCDEPICTQPCFNDGNCSAPEICNCDVGWNGTQCQDPICSMGCSNGASCSAPEFCICASGWSGTQCQTPICNITCHNGGNCTAPETCSCSVGWNGTDCQEPLCSIPCDNGGSCSSPDECLCTSSWTGMTCETPICSQPCLNGGYCSDPDTCNCTTLWQGVTCEMPVCVPSCLNGGDCIAPNSCNCSSGWTGSQCQIALCSDPCLNGGNCTFPEICNCGDFWEGPFCQYPRCDPTCQNGNCSINQTCECDEHWEGEYCQVPICNPPCLHKGECSSPNVCTCYLGHSGDRCEAVDTEVTMSDVVSLTDNQLMENIIPVTYTIRELATTIVAKKEPEKISEMLGDLGSILDRFGTMENFSSERFADIVSVSSVVADAMMAAVTADVTNDDEDVPKYEEDTMKCKVEADGSVSAVQPNKPPPAVDAKEKMRKVFNSFMEMLVKMFANLRAVLKPGMDMKFNGEFYGATVFNIRIRDISGLTLDTNLASANFAKVSNVFDLFGPLPAKCSPLTLDSTIPVVLSAFIVNVMDVDKPFNMPTVAVRMYCPEQEELVLNKAYPAKIIAKPSLKKAALFNNQKKDAQCDVSKVSCDLTENAEGMGSLAIFPVTLNAGDFVLIIPNIEYNYSAFIHFNSAPSPIRYNIQVNVTSLEASLVQNGTFAAPRWHYRPGTQGDLRIIIPEKAIDQYLATLPTADANAISIHVLTKRNFSNVESLDNLPSSACELQRTYGYHLRIGLAKGDSSKRKRAIDSTTLDGFQLEPESTELAVVFKSSYFGDFGADLVVSPNTIEFTDIFANFSSLVANNAGVLAFQCAAIFLFLVCVGVCWRFDKIDLKEWAFLPLVSNTRHHQMRYLVSVHISNVKNFKLSPKLSIRLIGNIFDTCWRQLDDGVRPYVLEGKRPANFTLTTHVTLGRIDAVELNLAQMRNYRENKTVEMHIDRVVVVDVEKGLKYVYLVKAKLIRGDTKTKALATEDEMKGYTYLISGHSKTSITDIHPWLSTMKRPLPSNWTRVERLATVVAALFMAMLVNAMFYGKEASAPKVGLKVGGFFTLSWFTLWTSFVGCIIVIPPTAAIAFIFKKIKRKSAEQSAYATVFNIKLNEAKGNARDVLARNVANGKKKPLQLPYWSIFIAWLLVASCIGTSAFFVVMYSLSWGQEKSLAWLSGMVLNVIQDIILIQPVKVVLTSIFSASLLTLPDDGIGIGKLTYNPKNNRRKVELFNRMRNVFVGIFHHAIYVIIFAIVIATMTNAYSFLQIASLRPVLTVNKVPTFQGTILDHSQIFEWLRKTTLPFVLNGNQLEKGGIFYSPKFLYRVHNPNVVLLGPIRLRQQRISPTPCPIKASVVPRYVQKYSASLTQRSNSELQPLEGMISCQESYSNFLDVAEATERRTFNRSWYDIAESQHYWKGLNLSYFEEPWIYRETEGISYSGWEASYKTGGYYVDLPRKIFNAMKIVDYLEHSRWFDNATVSVFVEFNLFNAQTNLFIPVKVVFEALSAGGMSYHIRMFPLQLYMYSGATSMLNFAVQGLWVILLLSHLVRVCRTLKKVGRQAFLANGWNVLDSIQVGLGLGIVAFFAARIYSVLNFIEKMQTLRSAYVNIDLLAYWEDLMFCLFGIDFYLAMFGFFRHLSVNKHWAIFMGTLSNGKSDLVTYGSVFALATVLFAGIAHLVMGHNFWNFSTYPRSVLCLIGSIIGTINFNAIDSPFYLFMTMLYTAIVVFLGTNFFVTLIMEAYSDVTGDIAKKTTWDMELAEYMAQSVNEIISRKLPSDSDAAGSVQTQSIHQNSSHSAYYENMLERLRNYADRQMVSFTKPASDNVQQGQMLWLDFQMRTYDNLRRKPGPVSMQSIRRKPKPLVHPKTSDAVNEKPRNRQHNLPRNIYLQNNDQNLLFAVNH